MGVLFPVLSNHPGRHGTGTVAKATGAQSSNLLTVWGDTRPPFFVGAGPARERERSFRQDARDLYRSGVRCSVSETRGNGGAFRDRSSPPWALSFGHPWPNRSLQAPPLPRSLCSGTATGQNTAWTFLRSGVCGGESPKEPRDRVCPSRTVFGQGWPKRSAARPSLQGCTRGVSWTGPPDPGAASLERKVSGILPGG